MLEAYFAQKSDLSSLFLEAEEFYQTGILPLNAEIRRIAQEVFQSNTAMGLDRVAFAIYRELALRHMNP